MKLNTPLTALEFIPLPKARQLARLELHTAGDLLMHVPYRYEDRTQFDHFPTETADKPVCVCGVVKKALLKRIRGSTRMFDVIIEEEHSHALSSTILLRWFNSHWVEKMIVPGQRLVVHGKPKLSAGKVTMAHPEFEIVEDDADVSLHLMRIVPIHSATEGISPRLMRVFAWRILERLNPSEIVQLLPPKLDRTPREWALRQMHFPDSWESLAKARRHLVLEEFLGMQLVLAGRRAEQKSEPGESHCGAGKLVRCLHQSLGFSLTRAQERAIAEIRDDLESMRPMNRLLHGDVGAGKTLVALSAMLYCVEAGFQAALMAPTQILAEQHYWTFKRLLKPLGIRVALRTGTRKTDDSGLPLFDGNPSSDAQIFVGTHALLYEGTEFTNLGLAVIDEQHKFGVMQRARLRGKGRAPDVLVMTATPIPRTLTMTLFGDLDVSTLDEVPEGRGKIITAVRPPTKLPDAVKFFREHLEAGRQCYVVYPRVEESDGEDAKAAVGEFGKWEKFFAPMRCELLHGRVAPEEKEAIMERFRSGSSKALVATTVIEVGIDVPNATLMLIENAERFGLAQLHQLRGRIGRGGHKSYCILMTSSNDAEALEKLRVLEETSNGFDIAEADLRLRGPGDLLGTAQSGLAPLRIGDLFRDADLMKLARNHVFLILEKDPAFAERDHQGCKILLADQQRLVLTPTS